MTCQRRRRDLAAAAERPLHLLRLVELHHPHVWASLDFFRAGRARGEFTWPEWCYVPIVAAHAVVTRGGETTGRARRPDRARSSGLAFGVGLGDTTGTS